MEDYLVDIARLDYPRVHVETTSCFFLVLTDDQNNPNILTEFGRSKLTDL